MSALVVDVLAVHRITRLVTRDVITRPIRVRLIRDAYARTDKASYVEFASEAAVDAMPHGDDEAPKLAALLTCPWCVSVYVAAGVLIARRWTPRLWRTASYGLALSSAAGLLSTREEP